MTRNNSRYAGRPGFTLVEIVIVVTVIGILAALTMFGFSQIQRNSRDSIRSADVTTMVEALEKYYDENGEYPNCSQITTSANTVSQMLEINKSALQAPLSSQENSYICGALPSTGTNDQFAYVGDGSADCQSGGACLQWQIQYRSEETGEIKTVSSRRKASLTTSGAPNLSISVASTTQINASWTAVPNSTSYRLDRSTSSTMSSAVSQVFTGTSTSVTGLTPGEKYYFRVTPKLGVQDGAQSSVKSATTTISAPSGSLTTTASLQSSNTQARGVASGVTCASGTTLEFSLGAHARNTNTSVSITYDAWGTGNTKNVSASQGYNYTFQSKARCHGSDADSAVVTSGTANVTRGIDKPAMPTYTGDTTMLAGFKYLMTYTPYCPSGTWVDGYIYIYNTGASGSSYNPTSSSSGAVDTPWGRFFTQPLTEWWYLGWAAGQVWEDFQYYAFYSCKTDFASSLHSDHRYTYVTLECEPARRSYNAYPRCDYYGQSLDSLPWGP